MVPCSRDAGGLSWAFPLTKGVADDRTSPRRSIRSWGLSATMRGLRRTEQDIEDDWRSVRGARVHRVALACVRPLAFNGRRGCGPSERP
jgi:hypothetical protein